MVLSDWASCPCCSFPCRASAMRAILAAEGACPMCGGAAAPDAVVSAPSAAAAAELAAAAPTGALGSVAAAAAALA